MRIIAGEHRGRILLPPSDQTTRPITDRVKQAIFDTVAGHLPDANVWDVFAGTGSFGLEAISRGAAQVTFVERFRPAVERLRKNIDTLRAADRSHVLTHDAFALTPPAEPIDVLFFDPPYPLIDEMPDKLRVLLARLTSPQTLVVFRHDRKQSINVLPLMERDTRTYGSMIVRYLRRPDPVSA